MHIINQNMNLKIGAILLNEIDSRIIKVIQLKPSISQRKIAEKIDVSYDTVRYHMENMRKQGIIIRKGNGRSGKWIVL